MKLQNIYHMQLNCIVARIHQQVCREEVIGVIDAGALRGPVI